MKRMKYIIRPVLLLTVLCTGGPVAAQRAYTLDECVREALANNVRMKNAANDVRMAEHGRQEALTNYFPTLSATGGGFITDKGMVKMEMAPGQSMSMMKDGIVGGVTAAVPIFTGGQVINGNKLSKEYVEVTKLQRNLSENEVRLTTERYFWQVVMLKEKLRTLQTIETQLARLQEDVQASVDAGLTTRNDLLQVQLRTNEMKSGRIQVENNLALSRNLLAQYVGHPADSIDVSCTIDESAQPEGPDRLFREPQGALEQTSEYQLLDRQVRVNELQHKMAVGKNLPTVALGGGYMYHNLMERDHSFWMGGVTVSVPITGWWKGSHEIKRHKLQVRNAENQRTDQGELLVIRMQHAWNDLNDAYKQIGIARLSIEQADENLRLNNDYYAAGTCTMSDLLNAQTLYQQSRDKYVETCTQYEVKKREYLQATGRQ